MHGVLVESECFDSFEFIFHSHNLAFAILIFACIEFCVIKFKAFSLLGSGRMYVRILVS